MGLSILELFLLVALFRLRRKGMEPANFEMAFDEYSSLRRGGSYRGVDETAPRPSAFRAFERLLSASLIAYTDIRYFIMRLLSLRMRLIMKSYTKLGTIQGSVNVTQHEVSASFALD